MSIQYCLLKHIKTFQPKFVKFSRFSSKVPTTPVNTLEQETKSEIIITKSTLSLLERLSLVKCDTTEGVKVLHDTISFANKILHLDTTNVTPLVSVLENE